MRASRRGFLGGVASALATLGMTKSRTSFAQSPHESPACYHQLPVRCEADICVLGGSCTGVFAAVRAARLGMKVAIVERMNSFGGVATNSLVNVWHSLYDTERKQQIIGGLTVETIDRLRKRDGVFEFNTAFALNTCELKIELDELVVESKIQPFLLSLFSEPYYENGELTGVIIDGKSGRGIIKAKYFIDATGDGDLCYRMGCGSKTPDHPQPPTQCAHLDRFDLTRLLDLLPEHGKEFNIPSGFVWGIEVAGTRSFMLAGTRMYGIDCADSDSLTRAEIEGRRQVRATLDLLRKYGARDGETDYIPPGLTALPAALGIRQSRSIDCLFRVPDEDALHGKHYDDAIANGSYVFDRHHDDKPGSTFMYLNGVTQYCVPGEEEKFGRWRPETATNPTFYQIPLRSIIPVGVRNVLVAGRMLDVQDVAFSGMRVMVNMNQLGEAAGVAAAWACQNQKPVSEIDAQEVRKLLKEGGSIVI